MRPRVTEELMSENTIERTETAFEFQGRQALGAAKNLIAAMKSTHADRLTWQPKAEEASQTRNVFEQVGECIRVNRMMAMRLSDDMSELPEAADPTTVEEAEAQLLDSAQAFADAIKKLDGSVMDRMYDVWNGLPGRVLLTLPVANMYYHMGQINMIQLLYGDTEFHFA